MAAGSVCKKHDATYYNNNDLGGQDDRYPAVDKMNHLRSLIGDEQYFAWVRGKFPRFMETPMSEIEKALDAKIAECEREINNAAWLAFAVENGIDADDEDGEIAMLNARAAQIEIDLAEAEKTLTGEALEVVRNELFSEWAEIGAKLQELGLSLPTNVVNFLHDLDDADTVATIESVRPL